ncbi:MAG: hypothetical protein R3C04_11350 [Hyphomonas sp.]
MDEIARAAGLTARCAVVLLELEIAGEASNSLPRRPCFRVAF